MEKIRGLDKEDQLENKGQMQSSFKEFEREKLENLDTKNITK